MIEYSPIDPGLLSTIDANGKRLYVHPFEVKGRFQRARILVQWLLLSFFLVLPWVQIGGRQALLLDIYRREFALFTWHFRAHDAPMLLFPLLGFTLLIALVTTLYGRVWCGWACPQTVFVEAIYRKIETWIEGPAAERRRHDRLELTPERRLRRVLKWIAYLFVSLLITHSFLALFMGSDRLLQAMASSPAQAWPAFCFIFLSTAVLLINFGWLREQFCLLACPYGRIQSMFVDPDTRTVIYDERRGEPRRGTATGGGDCVDCHRCVSVCPTAIDIRKGAGQLECLGCTACIDACDDVMQKVGKPPGLIRYDSENRVSGKPSPWIRGRLFFYGIGLLLLGSLFLLVWSARVPFSAVVLKSRGAPFQKVPQSDGSFWIANVFHAELTNRSEEPVTAELSFDPDLKLNAPETKVTLLPGEVRQFAFVLQAAPETFQNGKRSARVRFVPTPPLSPFDQELTLIGPYR